MPEKNEKQLESMEPV